jgi:preprotein translocase subunit SecG
MTFLYYTLLTALMFVAILLILLILIQKGRGGGLSSAFGGGGGSTAFGAKTGDVLTWATSIVFGIFIVLAVLLDLTVGSMYKSTSPVAVLPPTSSMPVIPAPTSVDNTPTTNPVEVVTQAIQNATTQPLVKLKSPTQP